jgi:hypothetical protein
LRYTRADTRRACELHTLNLWRSHADPDSYGYSNSYAYADSNTNGYSNSYAYADSYAYCYCNSYAYAHSYAYCDGYTYAYTDTYAYAYGPAETKPDTKARCDTAASPVSGSGNLIVHSAAGVERPRLRAFVRQASNHPGTKFAW